MYDGVIFDKDGVLLDSGLNGFQWMDRVRVKEAGEHGVEFELSEATIIGKGTEEDILELLDRKGISFEKLLDIERGVQATKRRMIRDGYIRLFPGAHRVLSQVGTAGMATNAPRETTEFTVDFFGLDKHFETVKSVKLEEGKFFRRRKPRPVMLEEVMDELGFENPVMVGDTSADVHAARNAGIDSVLVESYHESNGLDPTYRVRTVEEALHILR
jgi:phosphoglycolate phosphatase-like HAD superfamily hydrolase